MEKLKTIKRECSVEFEEKKSKFIASVKPVFSKEEAEEYINYMEVTNLVVIATRYFGGIKLGAGGLVRNYAKTAKLGITEAEIIDFVNKVDLLFEIPYEKLGEIEKLLKDYEAEVIDKSFLEKIVFKVRINEEFLTNLESYPYINLIDF